MTDLGVLLMLCVLGFLFIVLPRLYRDLIRRREWEGEDEMPRSGKAKWALGGLVLAVGVASFMYRLLVLHKLEQTSALFIGLPVVLAILVILFVQPKSATGMLCMATTIALLVSGIFLGEGFICILMAAPLFYAVAVVIGIVIDFTRKKGRSQGTMTCLLVVGFLPMSLEGVRPQLSFPREQTVVRESVVPRSGAEVEENLAGTPQFVDRLPGYLRMGFPRPTSAEGRGLKPGDVRLVHFAGGEGKPGDLVLRVSEANENHIVFKMDSDTSHVAHWLHWESAEVEWEPQGAGTRVRWTLHYRRLLDPAWYFAPWERYAVGLASEYLIESVAGAHR